MTLIEDHVRQCSERLASVAEEAVERMLVTPGDYGVIVHSWFEGLSFHVQANLTKDVPAMTIAYHDGHPDDTPASGVANPR